VQSGSRYAAENFNKFVEGEGSSGTTRSGSKAPEKQDFWDSFGAAPKGPSNDKKDFWDSFSAAGEQAVQSRSKPTSIGTSAMKKPSGGSGGASGGGGGGGKKDEDSWGDW